MSSEENIDSNSIEKRECTDISLEQMRKCQGIVDLSWDQSRYFSLNEDSKNYLNPLTPPNVNTVMTEISSPDHLNLSYSNKSASPNKCHIVTDLSSNKDLNIENILDDEQQFRTKRLRSNSTDVDLIEVRPWKKTKCTGSCTSSTSDLTSDLKLSTPVSSTSNLSSSSEVSFKSVNSNFSFKLRKRRLRSDVNLFKDVIQKSKKSMSKSLKGGARDSLSGTPVRDKSHRRPARPSTWRLIDLCSWIGMKSYKSITGFYTDILKDPLNGKSEKSLLHDEVQILRKTVEDLDMKQSHLARENEVLHEEMRKMAIRFEQLEFKLSSQSNQCAAPNLPPAPPPPPPPPPPPVPVNRPVRSNTLPRCGSATTRVAAQRLTITPQDLANVKLRKAKDNPVKTTKSQNKERQPLVTQQILQSTRALLGRARTLPVASSTPKQQLSELEKCILQEGSVASLYRRVARPAIRSAEDLRPRPYPHRRSPCSPRSNSHSRSKAMSPMKCNSMTSFNRER